jgi:hypothetical protein
MVCLMNSRRLGILPDRLHPKIYDTDHALVHVIKFGVLSQSGSCLNLIISNIITSVII